MADSHPVDPWSAPAPGTVPPPAPLAPPPAREPRRRISREDNVFGTAGWVLFLGLVLLALASLMAFFSDFDAIPDEDRFSALLAEVGLLAVALALAFIALIQRNIHQGVRAALVIASAFLLSDAVAGLLAMSFFGGLLP